MVVVSIFLFSQFNLVSNRVALGEMGDRMTLQHS